MWLSVSRYRTIACCKLGTLPCMEVYHMTIGMNAIVRSLLLQPPTIPLFRYVVVIDSSSQILGMALNSLEGLSSDLLLVMTFVVLVLQSCH